MEVHMDCPNKLQSTKVQKLKEKLLTYHGTQLSIQKMQKCENAKSAKQAKSAIKANDKKNVTSTL